MSARLWPGLRLTRLRCAPAASQIDLASSPSTKDCLQVKAIVRQANRFAERHLTQLGYLCYTGRLLHAYHQLLQDPQDLPSDAVRYEPDTWS